MPSPVALLQKDIGFSNPAIALFVLYFNDLTELGYETVELALKLVIAPIVGDSADESRLTVLADWLGGLEAGLRQMLQKKIAFLESQEGAVGGFNPQINIAGLSRQWCFFLLILYQELYEKKSLLLTEETRDRLRDIVNKYALLSDILLKPGFAKQMQSMRRRYARQAPVGATKQFLAVSGALFYQELVRLKEQQQIKLERLLAYIRQKTQTKGGKAKHFMAKTAAKLHMRPMPEKVGHKSQLKALLATVMAIDLELPSAAFISMIKAQTVIFNAERYLFQSTGVEYDGIEAESFFLNADFFGCLTYVYLDCFNVVVSEMLDQEDDEIIGFEPIVCLREVGSVAAGSSVSLFCARQFKAVAVVDAGEDDFDMSAEGDGGGAADVMGAPDDPLEPVPMPAFRLIQF